jgi:hypothetical protein
MKQIQKVHAAVLENIFSLTSSHIALEDSGDCVDCTTRDSNVTDAEWAELEKAKKLREEVNCFISELSTYPCHIIYPQVKKKFCFPCCIHEMVSQIFLSGRGRTETNCKYY